METGHARKGKRGPVPDRGRPAGSVLPATLLPAVGTALSHLGTEREGCAGNFDKIRKNTINIDKFTGFFDKKRKRENIVNSCYIMTCFIYLSRGDSNMSIIFFCAPHLPASVMNCAALPAYTRNCPQERRGGPARASSPPPEPGDWAAPQGGVIPSFPLTSGPSFPEI